MKLKIIFILVLLVVFTGSMFPTPTRSEPGPNLEILKVSGISEEVGSFRSADTTFFTQRNFFKQGMAFDSKGNLYITDSGDCQIEVFDENLKPLRHFGGIGTGDGQFQYLVDLKIDEDQIFALDLILGCIQVFDLQGQFLYKFSTASPNDANITSPTGFAISKSQHIFVMDLYNGFKIFSRKGEFVEPIEGELFEMFIPRGSIDQITNNFIGVQDIKSDPDGNIYILVNYGGDGSPLVVVLNPEGKPYEGENGSFLMMSQYLSYNGCFALEGDYFYSSLWDDPQMTYEGNVMECVRGKYKITEEGIMQDFESMEGIFPTEEEMDSGSKRRDLHSPTAFLVREEMLYFLDSFDLKIVKMNRKGEIVATYESPKNKPDFLQGIYGDNQGKILTTNVTKGIIEIRNTSLEVTGTIGKKSKPGLLPDIGELSGPYATIQDPKGYLYCSDLYNGCIQVFDPSLKPFYTIYPLYRMESPTGLYFDQAGNLLQIDQLGKQIFVFDISNIQKKVVVLLKRIPLGELVLKSLVANEKGNYMIPITEGGILAELSTSGKVIRKWNNPLRLDIDEYYIPKAIWRDDNRNYMLVDEWRGYFWKFDPSLKSIWTEKLNWFGIKAVWESTDGIIYALDKVHGLILTIQDKTFTPSPIPPSPAPDPPPPPPPPTPATVIIRMKLGSTLISINDKEQSLEAPPFRDNAVNRVFAPVRVLVETIKGTIEWIAIEQKVVIRKGDKELILVINNPFATLNGEKIPIDPINLENKSVLVVPKIVKGRLFLPLRFVSEQLGYQVEWIAKTEEIVLTYPDPKQTGMKILQKTDKNQSFGRVLGVTLSDTLSRIFSLSNGETLVLIGSGDYGSLTKTSVVKLDQGGNITSSQVLNVGFEQAIQLSNHQFLLVSKNRDWRVNQDGLIFTWLDPDGKLIQTKQFRFDYSHFSLPVIASVRELKEGTFEVIITGSSRDESANLKEDSTLRLLFNAEGSMTKAIKIPLSYYGLSAGELGITYPKWFESKDFGLSLYENSGKTQWSKKVKLPKVEKKKEVTDFRNQWLPDNSLLVSMINKNEDLYLTRLDGSGKSIWNVRITEKSKYKLVSLGSATLLSNGSIAVSFYLQEKDDVYYQPILVIDREGKIVRTTEINPEAKSIGFHITEGSEGNLWIHGSTVAYAFGSSNVLLFRLSGDMNTCYESKITFVSSGDVLVIEDAPKEKDLDIKPCPLKNSSTLMETAMDSVLALTKELCP